VGLKSKQVIRVPNFDFENGQEIKPRYFIVLDDSESSPLVISIVTSQDKIPESCFKEFGCIYDPEIGVHSYKFKKQKIICENSFSFPLDSYIYIQAKAVQEVNEQNFFSNYEGNIEHKGILNEDEFKELIYCVYKSIFIPKKIKSRMNTLLEKLYS